MKTRVTYFKRGSGPGFTRFVESLREDTENWLGRTWVKEFQHVSEAIVPGDLWVGDSVLLETWGSGLSQAITEGEVTEVFGSQFRLDSAPGGFDLADPALLDRVILLTITHPDVEP